MNPPTNITLSKNKKLLTVSFKNNDFPMSSEYLRVCSPSAEVRGHGPGQEKLQKGKEDVRLDKIEPVGNYAVKLVFDDGHDSGLYSWEYLHELCKDYKKNWHDYLDRLNKSGYDRKKP